MKTNFSKVGIYPLILFLLVAVGGCNGQGKSSKSKNAESGVSVKVKASKF